MAMTATRSRPAAPRSAPPPPDDRAFSVPWRKIAIGVLAAFGVFASWFVTTNSYAVLAQQRLADRWTSTVAAGVAAAPAPGAPVARISIPSLGLERVVLEGTARADLRRAPGHEPGTAVPGEIGNAVIRGHRLLWSAPFRDIGTLSFGAPIYVERADGSVVTFLVAGIFHMDPADPNIGSTETDRPMLTLVTSDPPFRADRVLVVKAVRPPEDGG
jgi:sortase A